MAWESCLIPISTGHRWELNSLDLSFQIPSLRRPTPIQEESETSQSIPPTLLPSFSSPSPSSVFSFNESDLTVIETNFDFSRMENVIPIYPRDPAFDRFPLTQKERTYASHAIPAASISDFSNKVCWVVAFTTSISKNMQLQKQLKSGCKDHAGAYLKLDTSLLDGYVGLLYPDALYHCCLSDSIHRKLLRINDVNQNLLSLICTNMPHHLKSNLLDIIFLIYPELLKRMESEAEGNSNTFYHAIHFDWYNRYTTGVSFSLHV